MRAVKNFLFSVELCLEFAMNFQHLYGEIGIMSNRKFVSGTETVLVSATLVMPKDQMSPMS